MTSPTIVPTKYSATYTDFLRAKVDRDGCLRVEQVSVVVPSGTASGTVIGLVPYRKGARFIQSATQLYTPDLDTSTNVTFDIGYVNDDGASEDPDAFASAITTAQSGGLITFDEFAGLSWTSSRDGWIAITTGGGSTTTTGTITGQVVLAYDA